MTKCILKIAVPTPLRKTFDYLASEGQYDIGSRVWVSFGRRKVVGVITGISETSLCPIEKLKSIDAIIDEKTLLDEKLLALYHWVSDYYHHPIGDVIVGTLPKKIREGAVGMRFIVPHAVAASSLAFELSKEQSNAVNKITAAIKFEPFLLAGVTGSGKTEVYLRVIAEVLKKNQQALLLVPEISLTPQTVSHFQERFSVPVLLLHSGLTPVQRYKAWMAATQENACIVIGTRSAIFAPLKNCGVIIVDEEHDVSFKQQSGFRYSARDVAMMRAKLSDIPIVLGTATPALETWKNSEEKKYHVLKLSHRVGNAALPIITIHNTRAKKLQNGLSPDLIATIKKHLNKGNQVLLFLNRRGYAPLMLCHHCGFTVKCKRCDTRLTLHEKPRKLLCHHCHYSQLIPRVCPECQQSELLSLGLGTEQLENTIQKLFPDKKVLRIDRDVMTTFKKLEVALKQIHDQAADIIVGTQMLVKGHHFENVTLVAAIDVDQALFSTDFRAVERLGQSLVQVAGRAGRAEKIGEVFIQTHHPDHPLLQKVLDHNYAAFAGALLQERSQALLPPYVHMALFRAEGKSKDDVHQFLKKLKATVSVSDTAIEGPFPLAIEKLAGRYRAQLVVQSAQRSALKNTITYFVQQIAQQKKSSAVKWLVDIDPIEMG
ncbi:MAG: primosomal protein N' [Coxiellaceae bacterium]|nr:primosomal protein N' [Coxiellaceae bacterium]